MNSPEKSEDANIRVLYIDDDITLAELAKRKLTRSGADVVHTQDADEAIEILSASVFDVVVLDHYLGNMTGHQVLGRFKEMALRVPVVYITGSSEASVAIDAMKNGASDYVIKSVADDFFPLLADAIKQTVANARLRAEKEKADEEIRIAKDRAESLLSEMNHRVANSLALVAGLLRLQINNTDDENTRHALNETQARITAIAAMHRSLYASDNVSEVHIKPYLGEITRDLAMTVGKPNGGPTLKTEIDELDLPADKSVSVGMIVSELVTNAYKYAYPDGEAGEIRVKLTKHDESRATLLVEDDGVGLNHARPNSASTGLGSKIVKTMAASLGRGITQGDRERGTSIAVDIDLTAPSSTPNHA
ncbi:histidine kinase dimerization/phosphoacceptor domain -containing protein [Rhizobium sp. L1K21]|uniref:sensor histidine kinase n=1 Tax=Rhizobium sp. L1K21 TaxID=2954933 RepID=UPI002093E6D8|nr:response regulator [Rhizobium sp. L1K21]